MNYLTFVLGNSRFLLFGFALAFFSSFGQTFFIGTFGEQVREEFVLTEGDYGRIYSIATLVSGFCVMWLGRQLDRIDLRIYAVLVCAGLIGACFAVASAQTALLLGAALFGLRLFGQGLLSHTAMTSMARYFDAQRGKAMSIAALGFPAGEAVLPILAVTLIAAFSWRQAWFMFGAALAVAAIPLSLMLLRGHSDRHKELIDDMRAPDGREGSDAGRRHWTRRQVLRDPRFYVMLPAVLAPGFIATGLFFHQHTLVAEKGWTAGWFATGFVWFAAAQLPSSLLAGPLVDRFGATRLLPWFLVPMGLGLVALAATDHQVAVPLFMLLTGVTGGMAGPVVGAAWAELYGVRHMGAIRSMITAFGVFATAGSPIMMGELIDAGVTMDAISLMSVGYALIGTLLLLVATKAWRRPEHPVE